MNIAGIRNNFMLRGLGIALSAFLLTVLIGGNIGISLADTSNDLRESLEISPNTYGTNIYSHSGVNTTNKGDSSVDQDYSGSYIVDSEDTQSEELATYVKIESEIKECESAINSLKSTLKTRLDNGSRAYVITLTVDDIIARQKRIDELKKTELTATDNIPNSKPNYDKSVNYSEEDNQYSEIIKSSFSESEVAEISSLSYNIGYIGASAPCIVEKYFKLVTPWGFTKHASEETYGEKMLGIDLYAKEGDKIISQWNGMVVDIGPDDSNEMQYIKIYHGNSTYTIYSHVYPTDRIYVGTKVTQGQIIAEAANTYEYETNKDNHVFYQVRLNGEFINPILVYGNRGQQIYETWLTSYAYDNVVESGEEYFNSKDEEWKIEDKKDIHEVIFPDFNLED